ncbi:unnamed protein product [Paramecium primaurelia]|uniref:Histone deacetylase n=2 Tax=Paramecium TaxID=5884 RepID=A0A8S1TFS1_9CILI|nr:unnamed protein product [Paramecium primaurelia]CAD8152085.1 unnamed protein product [Paramecium pentaurelia]
MNLFKQKVTYYYDEEFGTFNYSTTHPMKPLRVAITDDLVGHYGLKQYMNCIDQSFVQTYIKRVDEDVLTQFHSKEYIDLIKIITPENKCQHEDQLYRFNFMEDCPVLDRLFDFCLCQTSGSVGAACVIADQKSNIAINWSGGLHHAKQSEASGFCYVNDCVLGILELLKTYQRVLYIDIDIHHGDGVEEAFYLTDRVMTCSFHKFKEYFPGTGHIDDVGHDKGKYYAVNFPLNEGLNDDSIQLIFKPVIDSIMDNFKPDVIMLQGGTDSLSGDRLGCFNLSIKGHGSCIEYLKKFNVPIIMVGGGGYTLRNVPRCWTYETSLALNVPIPDNIPDESDYKIYFGPEYKLHLPISNMEEQNSKEYLEKNIIQILENLKQIQPGCAQIDHYAIGKESRQKIDYQELFSSYNDKREEMQLEQNQDQQD